MNRATAKSKQSLLLIGLAYVSFISLGLPDGLLGVAWPSIRSYFHLPIDSLGALLVMFTAGYLLSSFTSGRLLARISVGTLLALSCLATAMSLVGYALAPSWSRMVALGALAGLGAGAIDTGLNIYAARHFSARVVNWLHAFYGVGAAIGPLVMTATLGAGYGWQRGYWIVGVWQLILAVCFGLTRRRWSANVAVATDQAKKTDQTKKSARPVSSGSTLRLRVVWMSIAVFFLYTGLEAAAGTWAYSLFTESRSIPTTTAGMWVSVYWANLTLGRFLSGVIVGIVPISLLLRFSIIGIALGAGLIWLNLSELSSFLGLALMGLSSAPIFPTLIATTPARLGDAHTANGVGFQIAAAVLGQSLVPAFVGVLAGRFSLEIVGPALLAAALLLLALYEVLMAVSHKSIRMKSAREI
jgi:fucose permease